MKSIQLRVIALETQNPILPPLIIPVFANGAFILKETHNVINSGTTAKQAKAINDGYARLVDILSKPCEPHILKE